MKIIKEDILRANKIHINRQKKFLKLVKPLIKYLNDEGNPHTVIIITSTDAQLFEGVRSTGEILDYVKD